MTIIWLLVGLGLIVLGADIGLYDVSENRDTCKFPCLI